MNERKMHREYKTETAKMHISTPAQEATGRHRPAQDAAKRLAAV